MINSSGFFNYMSADSQSSLYRNGKVKTIRDTGGSDGSSIGINYEKHEMIVKDARDLTNKESIILDKHGFELLPSKIDNLEIDFFDNKEVINIYYTHCAELIKDITKASDVFAFDHNIRSATGKKSKRMIVGGQQVQGPAHTVHGDYTLTSAPERLRQLSMPPRKNDTLRTILGNNKSLIPIDMVDHALLNGRYAIINLWRNIVEDPVEVNPLALCDANTVLPSDLVVFEIHYADRVGENYFAKYNTNHDWYFYSRMTRNEVLLIKQWDSKGGLALTNGKSSDFELSDDPCTFSFHSAFEDPSTRENAPDRWSMEVRCVVIY